VALGGEVVDFVRANLVEDLDDRHRVAEVGVVKVEVPVAFEVGYTFPEVNGGTTDGAMYVVTFIKEKLREEGSVLAGNTGNKGCFHNYEVV